MLCCSMLCYAMLSFPDLTQSFLFSYRTLSFLSFLSSLNQIHPILSYPIYPFLPSYLARPSLSILSFFPSILPSTILSFYFFHSFLLFPSIYLPTYLFNLIFSNLTQSFYVPIYLSTYLPIYLSMYLCIYSTCVYVRRMYLCIHVCAYGWKTVRAFCFFFE